MTKKYSFSEKYQHKSELSIISVFKITPNYFINYDFMYLYTNMVTGASQHILLYYGTGIGQNESTGYIVLDFWEENIGGLNNEELLFSFYLTMNAFNTY